MTLNTFLYGKLFKDTTKKVNKLHVNITPDGGCFVIDPACFYVDAVCKSIEHQTMLTRIVNSIPKSEMKEFQNSKDVQEGMNIFKATFCKG